MYALSDKIEWFFSMSSDPIDESQMQSSSQHNLHTFSLIYSSFMLIISFDLTNGLPFFPVLLILT